MKKPIDSRTTVMRSLIKREINLSMAARLLNCSIRTIRRYRDAFLEKGEEGLRDNRHSNNYKLSKQQRENLLEIKGKDRWRSARNIRDALHLPVHETTVWRIFQKEGFVKENIKRVKPIHRFEADNPNDLWQTDIMGKITFPYLGTLYLIATLDDHSRFVPSGRWFKTQGKMNVFQMWYESLATCGLPKKMLQDEGSQYKARTRFGQADYQWYAQAIGIELIWAKSAQCKGKIERFWRFVQDDFVREVWNEKNRDRFDASWRLWLARYNYVFKSRYFGNQTRASMYHKSDRRITRVELETLLVVEERRKVTRESTISLYGKHYYVPPGYIGARIWVKIKGKYIYGEAMGKIFWKTKLKIS